MLRSDVANSAESQETPTAQQQDSQNGEGSALTNVRNLRTYQITDENAPGGKVDVEREDLAKGYEYGRTAVHISETDENITTLETYAAMDLIGFIQNDKVRLESPLPCDVYSDLPTSTIAICTFPIPTS